MKIIDRKLYFLIVGGLGTSLVLILSLINGIGVSINPLLFIILAIASIASQKIQFRVGDFTLTFDITMLIASYFILGFIPTLWLIFITNFIYGIGVNKSRINAVFYNTSLLLLMFIIIHYLYQLAGFNYINLEGYKSRISVGIFSVLVFILNWVLIFIEIALTGVKLPKGWTEGFRWDFYGNIIAIPLSIGLIDFYNIYDFVGLILLSVTIIIANLLFRLIRNLVFTNNELQVVHEVSVSISSRLELSETTSNILNGIRTLVNCEYSCIVYFDKEKKITRIMDSKSYQENSIDSDKLESYLSKNIDNLVEIKESFIVKSGKDKFVINPSSISKTIQSFIYQPLLLQNEIIGCVLICSSNNNKFFNEQLKIIDILASQAVIAIENAKSYKEAKNKAIKDSLTGLYNQRYFFDILDSLNDDCRYCSKGQCIDCKNTSLLILDIDHFKRVNDTYGHQSGDKILREVTDIIKDNVRKSDIVSRYGGEEFTVIFPNTSEEIALEIADRIRKTVESTPFYTIDNKKINITISGGVSEFPTKADTGSTLLTNADRAMYIGSKQKGRNKISKYVS